MNTQFTSDYIIQYIIQEILEPDFLHQHPWHVPSFTNPIPSSEEKCKMFYLQPWDIHTLLTTWGITLTLLNELSFNVGHNTYITK